MKHILDRARGAWRGFAAMAAALGLASCASLPAEQGVGAPRTLIRNVTVIPMDRPGSMPRRDVMVAGGRIVSLGRSGSMRPRASDRVIDGTGKYLMPGLWDMHVHAALGNAETTLGSTLPLYRSQGIVGVRDLGSKLELLQAVKAGLAGRDDLPAFLGAGPLLDGPKQPWMQSMALALGDAAEARAAAERLANGGVDFLKIYNNLSADQHMAVAEVAKRRGLLFAGHVPFKLSVDQVSSAGQKGIEHSGLQLVKDCISEGQKAIPATLQAWIAKGFPGRYEETARWWAKRDPAACQAMYRRLAERGTWVTPTLVNDIKGGPWTTEADLAALPEDLRKACASSLASIAKAPELREAADRLALAQIMELHRAGVGLLAGTDAPNECLWHGRSLHKELQMFNQAGLSTWETLKTATVNPARFLGRADEGVIRRGAVASLLLLDADPLADISNTTRISGVMLRGRWFPHEGGGEAEIR